LAFGDASDFEVASHIGKGARLERLVRIMTRSLVVVVTGSSAGLGRAIAHGFAKRGARIGLVARNPEALEAAKEECEALGGKALVLPLDVSDADAVDVAASRVEEEFGPIDVWVNDAMVSVFSPVKAMEASDYKRVTDVLYLGFVHGTLAALKRMLPRDRGTIIQIGSALSYRSIPLQSAYCACKHAINEHDTVRLGKESDAQRHAARAANLRA
jgi:NADP-dependent 3-hydroxy acid dehydrogenase YdfG